MTTPTLFDRLSLPGLALQNRVVMAPMTRNRAHADGTPSPLMATYYGQRSSAGLIVTEGTQPSAVGQGYPRTPGLYNAAHVAGWSAVTRAVHAGGAKIFLQIMHAGRVSHPLNNGGEVPVAPSAVALADGSQLFTDAAGL